MADTLYIKNAVSQAQYYFVEIHNDKTLLKGTSLDLKVALSLVVACRHAGKLISIKLLTQYLRTDAKEINRCYKNLKKNPLFR